MEKNKPVKIQMLKGYYIKIDLRNKGDSFPEWLTTEYKLEIIIIIIIIYKLYARYLQLYTWNKKIYF